MCHRSRFGGMADNDGSAPAPEVPSKPEMIIHDQGKLPPGTGSTTGDAPAPSSDGEALRKEIVRQVEFYFSYVNLPTDDFMLKHIKRNAEGWVPIRVLADFHKMRKLCRSFPTIVAALRTSTELEISPDGKRICRLAPLPEVDLNDIRCRTVITWNLPEKPTIEQVIELFSKAGNVVMARIRKPEHSEPLITKGLRTEIAKGARDCYALIEYGTAEEAARAVAQLNDESDWRRGLRVRPLLPGGAGHGPTHERLGTSRGGSPVKKGGTPAGGKTEKKGGKGPEGGNNHNNHNNNSRARAPGGTAAAALKTSGDGDALHHQNHQNGGLGSLTSEGGASSSSGSGLTPPPGLPAPSSGRRRSFAGGEEGGNQGGGRRRSFGIGEEAGTRPKGAWEQQPRKNRSEYAAWASAGASAAAALVSSGEGSEGAAGGGGRPGGAEGKKGGKESLPGGGVSQPRMPDGSRGFGMGRGEVLKADGGSGSSSSGGVVLPGLAGLSLAPGAPREGG